MPITWEIMINSIFFQVVGIDEFRIKVKISNGVFIDNLCLSSSWSKPFGDKAFYTESSVSFAIAIGRRSVVFD